MSLEQGVSLHKLIQKQGFLKPEVIRKIARGMCFALDAIHKGKFVHRDITPANVILRGDYENAVDGGVCVIDFGLAIPMEREKKRDHTAGSAIKLSHVAKKDGEDDLDLKEDELYLDDLPGGTPAYMAPEVIEDPALVDGRADLYGLGATLYHAATGHPPYSGDSLQAVLYQQRNQAPAPITQFNADFDEELGELILQLLSNSPNFRPKSAKLVLSKLQRMEDPTAVTSYKPPEPVAPVAAEQVVVAGFSTSTLLGGMVAGSFMTLAALVALPAVGVRLPALANALDPGRGSVTGPKKPGSSGSSGSSSSPSGATGGGDKDGTLDLGDDDDW
jgi:serine/threonine-protein kinase